MKTKTKIIIIIAFISVIVILFSPFIITIVYLRCNKTVYHWKVEKSIEEIVSIEIVDIVGYDYDNLPVICEIDKTKYSEIIEDIEALDARKYGWNLASQSGKSVKIVFTDGTLDIISPYEPQHMYYSDDGVLDGRITWLYFDKGQFDVFIEKWTNA